MNITHLTKEGILSMVQKFPTIPARHSLNQDFILQIVDTFYPSKGLSSPYLSFRVSDGFTKIRCFLPCKNQQLQDLQRFPLSKPMIQWIYRAPKESQSKSNISRSNEPFILIRAIEIVYEDIDHIIGLPLQYKIYEENGFRNAKGAINIFPESESFDFDELEKNLKAFEESVKKNHPSQKKAIQIPEQKKVVIKTNFSGLTSRDPDENSKQDQAQDSVQVQQQQPQQQIRINPPQPQPLKVKEQTATTTIRPQPQVTEAKPLLVKAKPDLNKKVNTSNDETITEGFIPQSEGPSRLKVSAKPQNVTPQPRDQLGQSAGQAIPRQQHNSPTRTNQNITTNQVQKFIQNNYQQQARQQLQQQNIQDYYPIGMLNNMTQHPFRGRVIRLDDVRTFGGKAGQGKVGRMFTIQVLDEQDIINCTFFEAAVDKFYGKLILGRIYIFAGAQIKVARNPEVNRQQGAVIFDANFDQNARIEECDDVPDIKQNKFKFVPLSEIANKKKDDLVDVIGMIKFVGQIFEFTPKNRMETSQRRSLTIYDQSLTEIEITLFGNNFCSRFDYAVDEIYQFKSFKVNEYNGKRTLVTFYGSLIHDDLTLDETKELADWRINAGDDIRTVSNTNQNENVKSLKTIEQILDECKKCEQDKSLKIYSNVRAHLMYVKGTGTIYYSSCTNCLKKVVQEGSGVYRCQSCGITMDEPKYRYIVSVKIMDSTGNLWASASDQMAQQLIGVPAEVIKQYNDQQREKDKIDVLNENVHKEYRFKLVSKMDEYNDQLRVKHQVVSIQNDSIVEDTLLYLNQIQVYVDNVC